MSSNNSPSSAASGSSAGLYGSEYEKTIRGGVGGGSSKGKSEREEEDADTFRAGQALHLLTRHNLTAAAMQHNAECVHDINMQPISPPTLRQKIVKRLDILLLPYRLLKALRSTQDVSSNSMASTVVQRK
jgi:hypothetical protein